MQSGINGKTKCILLGRRLFDHILTRRNPRGPSLYWIKFAGLSPILVAWKMGQRKIFDHAAFVLWRVATAARPHHIPKGIRAFDSTLDETSDFTFAIRRAFPIFS